MVLLVEQLHALVLRIQALNRRLLVWHSQDQASKRLAVILVVGVISAAALAASDRLGGAGARRDLSLACRNLRIIAAHTRCPRRTVRVLQ